MPRELILEAQGGVDHALVVDEDAVAEAAALDQAHPFELLEIAQEAEGPRRRDLVPKRLRPPVDVGVFLTAHGIRIAQAVVHREDIGRFDDDLLRPVPAHAQGPVDDDLRARPLLLFHPGLLDQAAELDGRAVHDGNLTVHLDQQVGDAVGVQGRHQVLHGAHHHAAAAQRRGEIGGAHAVQMSWNRGIAGDAAEVNAAVLRQRVQDDAGADPRMQPQAVGHDALPESFLAHRAIGGNGAGPRRRLVQPQLLLRRRTFAPRVATGALDGRQQPVEGERLLDEVEGAQLGGGHRRVDAPVARDHDDAGVRMRTLDLLEQHDAIHLGHPDVQQDHVRRLLRHKPQNLGPLGRRDHTVALVGEDLAYGIPDDVLVVHHQHGSLRCLHRL